MIQLNYLVSYHVHQMDSYEVIYMLQIRTMKFLNGLDFWILFKTNTHVNIVEHFSINPNIG